MLTVIGPVGSSGSLALRGLFIGDDEECFKAAAKLSLEVNFTLVPRPIQKVRKLALSIDPCFVLIEGFFVTSWGEGGHVRREWAARRETVIIFF